MKKSIILLGTFALLMSAPSFGQTQESTEATSTQKAENSAVIQKKEVTAEKAEVKVQKKSIKPQSTTAIKPTQNNMNRDSQKALRKEN